MADDLSILLSWFANISNYYSILIVLLCFSGMVIFIFRLNADNIFSSRLIQFQNVSKKEEMLFVDNPFFCELDDTISTIDVWGALINDVFKAFLKKTDIVEEELNDMVFMKNSLKIDKLFKLKKNCEECIYLECPESLKTYDLGSTCRKLYPLIMLMYEYKDTENGLTKTQTRVKILMTIFHIKDNETCFKSYIIGQYIKLQQGQVFNLQPIFLSTDQGNEMSNNNSSENMCVVCQNDEISHVILPCRHACVCSSCFNRLTICPMCRGCLDSYFILDGANITEDNIDNITSSEPMDLRSRWEAWNDRLNEFLGYR